MSNPAKTTKRIVLDSSVIIKWLSSQDENHLEQAVGNLPLTFISETVELAKETYKIASELGITYYNAAFLSLAKRLKAILITDNPKHQTRAKGVKVIALKDYL